MGAYEFKNIPDLTEAELKNPYSKFYYTPVKQPDKYLMDGLAPGGTLKSGEVLPQNELYRLFSPGYLPGENGYCVLPNGAGYTATNVKMPGVTPVMEQWWGGWFASDDIHYKIWLPGMHFGHQGVIKEDLGWGVVTLHGHLPIKLSDITDKDPKQLDPDYVHSFGGNMYFDDDGKRNYVCIYNYIRHCGDGLEMRTRSWIGQTFENGEVILKLAEGERMTVEKVRLLAMHHAYEFTRKADLLPALYEYSKTL